MPPLQTTLMLGTLAVSLLCGPARAQDTQIIRNQFGGVGLLDMPSARMAPDGEVSMSAGFFHDTQHYNIGFQALPWLETSFRYSGLQHFDPAFPVYYDRAFKVKARLWEEGDWLPALAIGINDLVGTGIYSGEYLVASKQLGPFGATLGMGWGRLATADPFRNPITLISSSFQNRSNSFGLGGSFNFNRYFHGPNAGVFGGLTWATPVKNLSFIAEYSSDRYVQESSNGNFSPRNQLNVGASYQLTQSIGAGLSWMYGTTLAGNVSIALNPTAPLYEGSTAVPPVPVQIRSPEQQQQALNILVQQRQSGSRRTITTAALADQLWGNNNDVLDVSVRGSTLIVKVMKTSPENCRKLAQRIAFDAPFISNLDLVDGKTVQRCPIVSPAPLQTAVYRLEPDEPHALLANSPLRTIDATTVPAHSADPASTIRRHAAQQSLNVRAIRITHSEALIYFTNSAYFSETEAVDRLLRVLLQDCPPEVEKFRLIAVEADVPMAEFDIMRATAERGFSQTDSYDIFLDGGAPVAPPLANPVLQSSLRHSLPSPSWSIFPSFRQALFDPASPFGVQFLAGVDGGIELLPGLNLYGEAEVNIYDNFFVGRPSDSVLPHVRTDFVKYFSQGKNGIGQLETNYVFRPAPDVFAFVRAGYLESMFGGVGGEVLWRPAGQRWALGADLYEAKQRDFNRLFGLQNYHVLTGHVSLYYDSPWYNLNFEARAGQYLAGDRGLTFKISRRFSTGVEIGVFATKTNVSAAQFGEGSFDKGIIIRIPLEWMFPIPSQRLLGMDLRPIQRDGGQVLGGDEVLYEMTRRTSTAEILNVMGH